MVTGTANPSEFFDRQVTFTLHTPSLRYREDADYLRTLEPLGLVNDELIKSRGTTVLVFHNGTSRHSRTTRLKTTHLFKKHLKVNPQSAPSWQPARADGQPNEIPEVIVLPTDKMHFASPGNMYQYNDASLSEWPHPDGLEVFAKMLEEGTADLFYAFEGAHSHNIQTLDYSIRLIKGVHQDADLMKTFGPFGNLGAFWQHPIAIRKGI